MSSIKKELKSLLRQRANILGSADLIKQFNDQYQEGQIHQVKVRIESLDRLWVEFAQVQDKIEELEDNDESDDDDEGDDDVEPTLSEQRIRFQNLYFDLKAALVSRLPEVHPPSTSHNRPLSTQPTHSVRLPEINIPEFSGNPSSWIVFRDIFRSMIHANVQLSFVHKMHYLKAALKGEAARIVANLEVNADNYLIAWKSVCERYDNPNLLRKHHFAALFSIPCVKRATSSSLYELVDEFDHHVGILEKLDSPANLWNTVLVETLSKRLDAATLKEWEHSCKGDQRPTYQQLVDFIRKTSRVLQSVSLLQPQNQEIHPWKPKPISAHLVAEIGSKCSLCKQAHPLFKCDQFLGMESKQRFELVKKHGLCINCLKGTHLAKNCSSGSCRSCSKKHHTLLHLPPLVGTAQSAPQTALAAVSSEVFSSDPNQLNSFESEAQTHASSPSRPSSVESGSTCSYSYSVVVAPSPSPVGPFPSRSIGSNLGLDSTPVASFAVPQRPEKVCSDEIFLSTVVMKVKDANGNYHCTRGVLDSCSQANFISESLARKLELKRDRTSVDVSGIGQGIVHIRSKVLIKISSRFGRFEYLLECLVIPQITVTLPSKHIDISRWNLPTNIPLADPRFNISSGVDILIGGELFYSLMETHKVHLSSGYPMLQKTVFGYVVAGKLSQQLNTSSISIVSATASLDSKLQRFWEIENFDDYKAMSPMEEACEEHFCKTITRTREGRYMVRLPIREEMLVMLGDSYAVAQRRFLAIERKFAANVEFKSDYVKFMEEYAALGHMELSPRVENPQFVLPHHAIFRPDSSTTKTRVVFDATCKGSTQLSLNDLLLVGPTSAGYRAQLANASVCFQGRYREDVPPDYGPSVGPTISSNLVED